jgi:hypothetical protein
VSRLDTVRDKTAKVKDQVAPRAASARESAAEYADKVAPKVGAARDAARDAVAPHLDTAREKVRDDVIPKVTGAAVAALAASEPVREEARSRGTAALAALKGELTAADVKKARRKRGGKFRKALLVLGLAGAAGGVWAWWKRKSEPSWETEEFGESGGPALVESGGPGPAQVWAPSEGEAAAVDAAGSRLPSADEGGGSPGEALADASDRDSQTFEEHASPDGRRSI